MDLHEREKTGDFLSFFRVEKAEGKNESEDVVLEGELGLRG